MSTADIAAHNDAARKNVVVENSAAQGLSRAAQSQFSPLKAGSDPTPTTRNSDKIDKAAGAEVGAAAGATGGADGRSSRSATDGTAGANPTAISDRAVNLGANPLAIK